MKNFVGFLGYEKTRLLLSIFTDLYVPLPGIKKNIPRDNDRIKQEAMTACLLSTSAFNDNGSEASSTV